MKYVCIPADRRFFGPVHWGHQIHLYLSPERFHELGYFLDEVVGPNKWRISGPLVRPMSVPKVPNEVLIRNTAESYKPTIVKFLDENHAMRMKLMWNACEPPVGFRLDPVLISLVRRTMPNLIAANIIGVSPMAPPSTTIFELRRRFSRLRASILPKWKRRKRKKRARL